jgi:hypothetical protein
MAVEPVGRPPRPSFDTRIFESLFSETAFMSLILPYNHAGKVSTPRMAGLSVSGTTIFVGISLLLAVMSAIALSKGLSTGVMF